MIPSESSIKAKCRRCGREANSGEMVLDVDYGMVVCPICIKQKKKNSLTADADAFIDDDADGPAKSPQEEGTLKKQDKPPGWDIDDEYLQRALKRDSNSRPPRIERIRDSRKVKYFCKGCKYPFRYDLEMETPTRCPYCNTPVDTKNM